MSNHFKNTSMHTFVLKIKEGVLLPLFLFSISATQPVFANDDGIEKAPIFSRLSGIAPISNYSQPLLLNALAEVSYTAEGEISRKIKNIITLSIIEETPNYIPVNFSATIRVRIDYGHSSSYGNFIERDLTVDYNKNTGAKYNAKNYFSFDGAEFVKVTVIGPITITPQGTVNFDLREVLLLENEMRVTQYFELNNNVVPFTFTGPPSVSNPADEVSVSWSWIPGSGNNHTQLEWAWLEEELESAYYIPNTTTVDENLLFKNNSTRIDLPLSFNSYSIPLFYDDTGVLYYRIRPVNIKNDGNRSDGQWTSARKCSYEGHNNNLNWQASTIFAEEGKRKSTVEYFDGSQRSRQTVTKDNVTQSTITAETFYDGQGRPTIQILPTPGISGIIQYQQNLNLFNTQLAGEDPAKYFDLVAAGPLNHSTPPLNAQSGTSRYYSSSNDEINQQQNKFIPDAEGYPYSVTRYMPDATGRIMMQSSAGASHKMGSGKEIKYYYGGASQVELDGLFGTEAGNYTHYEKNMVKDANGQMSVSYVDMHGRTIATALAGESPNSLDALATNNSLLYPNQNGSTITRSLLDESANIIKENSLESINTVLVPAKTTYSFQYQLAPDKLQIESCNAGVQLCYDCLYDLEISITEVNGDTVPIVWKFTNVSINPDDNCNTGTAALSGVSGPTYTINGNTISFSRQLEPGSYSIRKTLTISESSIQKYLELVEANAVCKTRQQLIDSVAAVLISQTDCGNPSGGSIAASCTTCLQQLGVSETVFRTNYLNSVGLNPSETQSAELEAQIHSAYQSAYNNCQLLCDTTTTNSLATIRSQMLEDMKPYSGQYAIEVAPVVSAERPSINMYRKYDIFSTFYSGQPFYKSPKNAAGQLNFYRDASGMKDQSIHYLIPPSSNEYDVLNNTNQDAFQDLFKDSWAEALLPYHPEYNKLIYAETNLRGSYNWIDVFSSTSTYAQALTKNYVLTTGSSTAAPYNDSFYILAPTAAYRDVMLNKINNQFIKLSTNPDKWASMWQMARATVKCNNVTDAIQRRECIIGNIYSVVPKLPPYADVTTDSDKNTLWEAFQGFYMNERRKDVNKFIKEQSTIVENDQLIAEKYTLHFHETDQQIANQGNPTGNGQSSPWTWFPSIPGNPPSGVNLDPATNNTNNYTTNCDGYIEMWKAQLMQCPQVESLDTATRNALLTTITNGMKQVCINGSDAANPYGSSNVRPGVTTGPLSFEEVINNAFATQGISRSNLCNPYMIEWPKPYGKSPKLFQELTGTVDSCACANFALIKGLAIASEYDPSQLPQLNEFLWSKYQDTLTQVLFNALQNCNSYTQLICEQKDTVITANCYDPEPCQYISSDQLCLIGTPTLYQKFYGGTKDEFGSYSAPTIDSGYIVAGRTNQFGNGGFDGLLMKIDKRGNLVWSRALGGVNNDEFSQIKRTSDNGFIICGATRSYGNAVGDAWLIKLDASGNVQWSKKYGDGNVNGQLGSDVTQLSDGGFAFCGIYRWANGSGGLSQSFVVRTDAQGNVIWSRQYPVSTSASDDAYGIMEDGNSIVVSGIYNGQTSFMDGYLMKLNTSNGALQWVRRYDAEARSTWVVKTVKTNTGYQALSGITDNFTLQNQQLCIWNLNSDGTVQNVRKLVIPGVQTISGGWHGLANGDYVVAQGENTINSDVLLSRVSASGTIAWTKRFQRTGRQLINSILPSTDNGYILTGSNNNAGTTNDSSNVYLMKIDSLGDAANCSGIGSTDVTIMTPSIATANLSVVPGDLVLTNLVITVNVVNYAAVSTTVCSNCQPVTPVTCEQYKHAIASFYDKFGAAPGGTCTTDFVNHFNYLFQLSPARTYQQIADGYLAACGQSLTICVNCTTQFTCKVDSSCRQQFVNYQLPSPERFPEFLKCGSANNTHCFSCAELSTLTSEFKTQFTSTYNAAPVFNNNDPTDDEIASNILYEKFLNYKLGLQVGWRTYASAASSASCNLADYLNNGNANQNVICGDAKPVSDTAGIFVHENPCQRTLEQAEMIGNSIWIERKKSLLKDFEAAYRAKCFAIESTETFNVTYTSKEYHYTLFYYDLANNLVKTVPPKGVRPDFSATYTDQVKIDRANGALNARPHEFITQYRYSSLNKVIAQHSPDANVSKFWYDVLGRLVVSQNAQQSADNNYSYTLFDLLGRITEVGQKPQGNLMTQTISQDPTALENWILTTGGTREQITHTTYDLAYGDLPPNLAILDGLITQKNLRNRVSFTTTWNFATDPLHHTATFYTYDIHGNIDSLVQDYKGISEMDGTMNRFKLLTYAYDFLSGKINEVHYQPGKPDAFHQRYKYDADNKLLLVETSRDQILWECDARYLYYKYGPLARVEYGKLRVQGMDYAYNIQGLLKGVNSTAISAAGACGAGTVLGTALIVTNRSQFDQPAIYRAQQSIEFETGFESDLPDVFETEINPSGTVCDPSVISTAYVQGDIGRDGDAGYVQNATVARDAFGFALNYFNNDYKPIDINVTPFANGMHNLPQNGDGVNTGAELFNGNIASMLVNVPKLGTLNGGTGLGQIVYGYRYDQLNRIVGMNAYSGFNNNNNTFTPTTMQDYRERVSYDPNGNILTYQRNGNSSAGNVSMDDMNYDYYVNTNRLKKVSDIVPDANYGNDIDDQPAPNNYTYDLIGNLIADDAEGINSIQWTIYGKIKSITKGNGTTITYTYNTTGNRIAKTINPGAGGVVKTMIYVRDASGNVVSIYEKENAQAIVQTENHLYGSSRIGMITKLTVAASPVTLTGGFTGGTVSIFTRNERQFELCNHLGNVLVTVSDKKLQVDEDANGVVNYYTADVITANDYYPFGMLQPGRSYKGSDAYRYGFNGKENDNEVKGIEGSQQDYGMRIYDPRLGKFLSVDPLTRKYPWYSPYQFAGNKPIQFIDLDGGEETRSPGGYAISDNKIPRKGAWLMKTPDVGVNNNWEGEAVLPAHGVYKFDIIDDHGQVFTVYRGDVLKFYIDRPYYESQYYYLSSDHDHPQSAGKAYSTYNYEGHRKEFIGSLVPFETQGQIDKANGNTIANIFGALPIVGIGTVFAAPVLIANTPMALRLSWQGLRYVGRGLANEASLFKYIPKKYLYKAGEFATNMVIQVAVNGKDADVYDAAMTTINPWVALFTNPLINAPISGNVTITKEAPLTIFRKYATSAPFFMLGRTMENLGTKTPSSEYLLNSAEEATQKALEEKEDKKN